MPPKKTVKAAAAEEKKRNIAQAEDIVAKLKLEIAKPGEPSTTKSSRHSTEKPRQHSTAKRSKHSTAKPSTHSTDKPKESSEGKVAMVVAAEPKKVKEIASKRESSTSKDQGMVPASFALSEAAGSSSVDNSRDTEHVISASTSQRAKSVKSLASSSTVSKKYRKPGNSKVGEYQYEIDCQKVADSIDVTNLKEHLEKHLKVDGKKNNLDGTISIDCKGNKAIIKSNTFLPKKSLRFLSKKFLKKNWNIRVVSKNAYSYEYKYIGSL